MNTHSASLTDEELAVEAQAGSQSCFEELISRYSSKLLHFLRPKIYSEADIEDIIQDTFFKLYQNIFRYDPKWKFSTWLYTAAHRQAISHYRTKKKRDHKAIPVQDIMDPEEELILKTESQNMWKIAKSLKPEYYEVLWLRYVEEMNLKEIARVMHGTNMAIRMLLHRARLNMAKKLQPLQEKKRELIKQGANEPHINLRENLE